MERENVRCKIYIRWNPENSLENILRNLQKKLKLYPFIMHLCIYIVTKFKIQNQSRKNHMKITRFRCICIRRQILIHFVL
jgi:hypothetical protein